MSVIPFRRPVLAEPPDTLMALIDAADGLPDETVARLIDHYFPEALTPAWQHLPTMTIVRRAIGIPRGRGGAER